LFRLKRRGTISFLEEKKQKTLRGGGCLSEKRNFSARPARNGKTDGSYMNRPFCVAGWRRQQERRKEGGTFSFLEEKKQKTQRGRMLF
jgi:hypothetical protein